MTMHYGDWFESGMASDCCGASVYINGICSACKDHCTPVKDEEEKEEAEFLREELQ